MVSLQIEMARTGILLVNSAAGPLPIVSTNKIIYTRGSYPPG